MSAPAFTEFILVYQALAAELLGRCQGEDMMLDPRPSQEKKIVGPVPSCKEYWRRLPESVRQNFLYKRRCTFSWMTDTTTMYLLTEVMASPSSSWGAPMLYNLLVGHLINDVSVLQSIGFPFSCQQPPRGRAIPLVYPFYPLPRKKDDDVQYSNVIRGIGSAFSGSSYNALKGLGATIQLKLPAYIHKLGHNHCRSLRKLWERVLGSHLTLFEVLRESPLGVPAKTPTFMALVVARLASVNDPRLFDLEMPLLGEYAKVGLLLITDPEFRRQYFGTGSKLAPKKTEAVWAESFQTFVRDCKEELEQAHGFRSILDTLVVMGIEPLSMQSFEHLLCEYRKLVDTARGKGYNEMRRATRGACFQQRFANIAGLLRRRAADAAGLRDPVRRESTIAARHGGFGIP
jgi:hypothetical protein